MSLFHPNTNGIREFKEKGLFLMAWRLTLTFSLLFSVLTISFLFYRADVALSYAVIAAISVACFIYVSKTQNPKPIFWILAVAGSILAHTTLYLLPEALPYSNFLWIIAGIVFVYVALGKQAGWLYVIINTAGIVAYLFLGLERHLESLGEFTAMAKLNIIIEMTAALIIVAYLMNQYQIYQTYARLQVTKLNLHLEQQNEAIIAHNKENITLVKEVHHRVKNNLQIIISLLRMQRSEIKSKEYQRYFDDMINRVMTMSMIHQRLYQEKEVTSIDVKEYLSELCNEVISVGSEQDKVNITVTTEIRYVDLKTIVPLGLLINELVSNSVKHAFSTDDDPWIKINIKYKNHGLLMTYSDSGEWNEEEKSSGFGTELIQILSEQLDGSYDREGTTYTFQLNPFEE